jgi:hypothetical protein
MINNKNFMDIVSVFQKFKTQKQAIKHLGLTTKFTLL